MKLVRKKNNIIIGCAIAICILCLFFWQQRSESRANASICKDCNVILISVDSLRADHVSAYGYTRHTTPNLDAFAKKGVLFKNYFTTSFLTPVSEMSVHTGQYPSTTGVTNFDTIMSPEHQTLATFMKEDGYTTAALFSSPEFSTGNIALYTSFKRDFDTYEYLSQTQDGNVRPYPTAEKLQSELDSASKNNKFFLWMAIGGVHWPYGYGTTNVYADPTYSGVFKEKILDWEVVKNIYQDVIYPSKAPLTQADTQYIIDQYDNGVVRFDQFIGIVMKELDQRGLLENTIVVIQSEHGEDFNEHGYFAHYDVTDTQTHTPLIIYTPTQKKQTTVQSFSSSVDVLPTIIDLLGKTPWAGIQGKSLKPIITGEEQDGLRQEAFIERSPLWEEAYKTIRASLEAKGIPVTSGVYKDIAIRTSEWKYILRTAKDRVEKISWWATISGKHITIPEAELYDIKNDPLEQHNVISAHPDIAQKLKSRLLKWQSNIQVTSPTDVEHSKEIQPYF